jgi:hypothetical protein
MRCFSTPEGPCLAVCPDCTEHSTPDQWNGWSEQDPAIQECVEPTHCARCGKALDC